MRNKFMPVDKNLFAAKLKYVQRGGSLQNVYKRWFIASECFRAGTTFPDLTQLFQLKPILPHHHQQQQQDIIGGPYTNFPLFSLLFFSIFPLFRTQHRVFAD